MIRAVIATLGLLTLTPNGARAHPHEWIEASFSIRFDRHGRLVAIRHYWRLDAGFTAFAVQGLDKNGDGRYSAEELKPLAEENVQSLKEFDYFTFVSVGEYKAGFAAPKDYRVDLDGDRLILNFTLPIAQPFLTKSAIDLQVYDPSYYLAVSLPGKNAVTMEGAPAECRLTVRPATGPSAGAAAMLSTLGADQRQLPPEMQGLTEGIDNSVRINCDPKKPIRPRTMPTRPRR